MASFEKRTWWSKHRLTERLKAQTFLEAAVSSCFVIAAADGNASEQEYDALLDRLEILGGIDRDAIDEQYTAISNELEANGFAPQIARIGELVSGDAANAVLILAVAIALADDDVSAEEREVIGQLAAGVGLGAPDIDALVAEIQG